VPQFLWHCLMKQILLPHNLVRYILVRAFFVTDNGPGNPYRVKRRAKPLLKIIGLTYHLALIGILTWIVIKTPEVASTSGVCVNGRGLQLVFLVRIVILLFLWLAQT